MDAEARSIKIHSEEDFAGMRKAGRLAAETLDIITDHVVPGVSTEHLDALCAAFVADFIRYEPLELPAALPQHMPSCTSVLEWQAGDCFDMAQVATSK